MTGQDALSSRQGRDFECGHLLYVFYGPVLTHCKAVAKNGKQFLNKEGNTAGSKMAGFRTSCRIFGLPRLQMQFPWRPARMAWVSKQRPFNDYGVLPVMIVVFDDGIAANHFLRVALEETEHTGVHSPLLVSCNAVIERIEPLGRAWQQPERVHAMQGFSRKPPYRCSPSTGNAPRFPRMKDQSLIASYVRRTPGRKKDTEE